MTYPYISGNPISPIRDHDTTQEEAQRALHTGKPVYGIKGPSPLSRLPQYDLIKGTAIDYMHSVLLGVTRKLLHHR